MNKGNLRTSGSFGKKPVIGLMMLVVGGLIFAILAYNVVTQGPLLRWDVPVAESFHALALNSPASVMSLMIGGYYIGLQGIVVVAVLLGLYFLCKRFWRELVMIVVAFGGGGILFKVLSKIFMRPRPFLLFDKRIWLNSPNIPGFPSGHTLNIVICAGFLTYLILPAIKSRLGKASVIAIASIVALYIGFSRLYIGDHYLTDLVAGYALGVAWFGFACTSVELLFQRFSPRKEKDVA